jgi:hypothetical protein
VREGQRAHRPQKFLDESLPIRTLTFVMNAVVYLHFAQQRTSGSQCGKPERRFARLAVSRVASHGALAVFRQI